MIEYVLTWGCKGEVDTEHVSQFLLLLYTDQPQD